MDAFTSIQAVKSLTFTPTPLEGSLTLPEICDYHSQHSPNHSLFVYRDGKQLRKITWTHAARSIHTAARFVEASLPHYDMESRASIAIDILSNADYNTYYALVLGIIRTGYHAFPINQRVHSEGLAYLAQQTRLQYFFVNDDQPVLTCVYLSGKPFCDILYLRMSTFEQLFLEVAEEDFIPLPPITPPDQKVPALILHSSGRESLPKSDTIPHTALLQRGLGLYYGDIDICGQIFAVYCMSLTTACGAAQLVITMMSGLTLSSFPPFFHDPELPSPVHVLDAALETQCTIMLSGPDFIEAWATSRHHIASLSRFRSIIYASASLNKDVGDLLAPQGVWSSRTGCISSCIPAQPMADEWAWFRFSSECCIHLAPCYDDMHQVVALDSPSKLLNAHNTQTGSVMAYDTTDLLIRHPTSPHLWKFNGEVEDLITHSNGLKTHPFPLEYVILKHTMIKSAIVFGHGRVYPGVLIQPDGDYAFDPVNDRLTSQYKDAIWPVVEAANQSIPAHSRIPKDMILVTSPSKPVIYTAKNTLDRPGTLRIYEAEINGLYTALEASRTSLSAFQENPNKRKGLVPPSSWGEAECLQFVRAAIETIIPFPLGDDDDFFQAGCDSIQAIWLRNTIFNALRQISNKISSKNMPRNFVYFNPTIRRLAAFIRVTMNYGHSCVTLSPLSGKFREMEQLVGKYAVDFPQHNVSDYSPSWDGDVILLTGSTGSLGSHLLEGLVNDPSVARVYALNRPDIKGNRSVFIRQSSSFRDRELDYTILYSDKLTLLEGDICATRLGLEDDDVYDEIVANVTCIIHCAWNVNFNLSLCSLEPLIAGTRNLIDLALSSPHATPPRFLFTSSLSVFSNASHGSPVPESYNPRPVTAIGYGYTESKWVAESILTKATEQTALRPSIIRLGQSCGGRNGSWNPREWFPTLIRSAQILRCIPQPAEEHHLSWTPVHDVAMAIIEMRHSHEPFLNLTHPNPTPASPIFEALADILNLPLVKYSEWLTALEASIRAPNGQAALRNPALILLDFYRSASNSPCEVFGNMTVANSRAMQATPNLCQIVKQLSRKDVESWVNYWRKIGFLA